jgi:hypothetical protein
MISLASGALAQDKSGLAALTQELDGNKLLPEKIKVFAKDKLLPLVSNEIWVKEVTAQNAKNVSIDEIKKLDQAWIAAVESKQPETALQKEKLSNACALEIKKIIQSLPAIVEAFVMDNQGAVVGENNLTSDYWQGDEPKWTKSYNAAKGGMAIGEPKIDKSVGKVLQQISLPILDTNGKVIGAVTFGLAIDKL